MPKVLFCICIYISSSCLFAQQTDRIYLLPGQGSDERIFSKLVFDSLVYEVVHIHYPTPPRNAHMQDYAALLSSQIDTSLPVTLIGVSLGGMLAIELSAITTIKKVIIISSAKSRKELPLGYRTQRFIPIYRIIPSSLIKASARIVQPIFEPDRKVEKATFVSMLKNKNKYFMKRGIGMIVRWSPNYSTSNLIHVHGTKDHTLPIRRINSPITVNRGSHMMTLTMWKEVQMVLNEYL